MRVTRVDFIKEIEEQQAQYRADKALAELKEEKRIADYQKACQDYLREITKLLEQGIACEVEKDRYNKQSLSIVFPAEVTIPEAPKLIDAEETHTYRYLGYNSAEHEYKNREKLLITLRVSADAEITLTKQILDMM